jgi:hypothetical protein
MSYDFDTSKPAHEEAKRSNIDFCRQQVFTAIRALGICTDKQIAEKLKWPINRVTPRRGELVESGLVECARKDTDPVSNRKVNFWQEKKVIPAGQQLPLL